MDLFDTIINMEKERDKMEQELHNFEDKIISVRKGYIGVIKPTKVEDKNYR